MAIAIKPIIHLDETTLTYLIEMSEYEGYSFIRRLYDEYQAGDFDQAGAIVYGVYAEMRLVGIGAVNRDPYMDDMRYGRIRHVYILPSYRRGKVGTQLMQYLIDYARQTFSYLTLRTMTERGDAFYLALGFKHAHEIDTATHILRII